jgi:heterodisulfide reductase subunit B
MKIGYYPGCSLLGSSRDFGESVVAVARALEVELVEVPDWTCCGASSAHAMDHLLAVALPAGVLASAARAGLDEVVAPCASCFNRLASARHAIQRDPALRKQVEQVLDVPAGSLETLAEKVRVLNVIDLLQRCSDRIAAKVTQPFARAVACYYGCLLVRPGEVVGAERVEDPVSMDALVEKAGGKPVAWSFKTECCGAALSIPNTPLVGKLGARIVEDAAARQAEAIVVACPMCHSNLDMRRGAIDGARGKKSGLPVLFITQVVGLALGLPPSELGLERHFVPVNLSRPAAPVA